MCQVSPALLRNYLAWLAIVLRLVLALYGDWFGFVDRVAADIYWATRQNEPGYLAFKSFRDEADEIHRAWLHHELTDPDARDLCQALALRLRQWDHETTFDVDLFSSDFWYPNDDCPPFRSFNGRRGMFESQEGAAGDFPFCNYVVFTF